MGSTSGAAGTPYPTPAPAVTAVPPVYGAPGYYPSPADYDRTRRIDRTKTGILLILMGTLLSWIPYLINLIGYLFIFIGLVLLVLGRRTFGTAHARNVVLTIVLLFVGIGALFGSALPLGFTVAMAQVNQTQPTAAELTSDFQILLVGQIIGAVAFGLMSVLFTYALQKQEGRLLLLAGFGASVGLSAAIYVLVAPLVPGAVQQALAGGTFDATIVASLENLTSSYGLLNAIPSLLFAAGGYLAWSRVNRGEIPAPLGAPTTPAPASAYPGTPPQAPPPSGPAPPVNPK